MLICLLFLGADADVGRSEYENGSQPTQEVDSTDNPARTPVISPLLLPHAFAQTPRRSSRKTITDNQIDGVKRVESPSSGSSKRKRNGTDSSSPKPPKARRISSSSNDSPDAGPSKRRKFKSDKKGKSKDGKAPHPKKAVSGNAL